MARVVRGTTLRLRGPGTARGRLCTATGCRGQMGARADHPQAPEGGAVLPHQGQELATAAGRRCTLRLGLSICVRRLRAPPPRPRRGKSASGRATSPTLLRLRLRRRGGSGGALVGSRSSLLPREREQHGAAYAGSRAHGPGEDDMRCRSAPRLHRLNGAEGGAFPRPASHARRGRNCRNASRGRPAAAHSSSSRPNGLLAAARRLLVRTPREVRTH